MSVSSATIAPSMARAPRALSRSPQPAAPEVERDYLECDLTALVQAQGQALACILETLGPGAARVPIRFVKRRNFAALLASDPLHSTVQALQAEDPAPLARAARWLRRGVQRLLHLTPQPLHLPNQGDAAFLLGRQEVVVCDDWLPDDRDWSVGLRVPMAMAVLHQRAPRYLGAMIDQWASHVRYWEAHNRPEMSAELLLSQACRNNARARWAWWYALSVAAAEPQKVTEAPQAWAHTLAVATGVPALLLQRFLTLFRRDPVMLQRTYQDATAVDALAQGPLQTQAFVPYGQTEATLQRLDDITRRCPNLQHNIPVIEFAPLSGKPLDPRQAPVAAAKQLLENGFCPEALRVLEETLYLNPDHMAALLAVAELYLQQDRPDDARACYEHVLTLHPHHRRARLGLSRVAAERGLPHPQAPARCLLEAFTPAPRLVLPRV